MDNLFIVANLLAALLLGALIGIERQWRQRLAVLRTNALVALGAASFTVFASLNPGDASPSRVAAQVVSGIGFLGAGVIMREGLHIRGLNTAATLWCAAAVGLLAGAGQLLVAALVSALILIANVLLRPLAGFINRQPEAHREDDQQYLITVVCRAEQEAHIRALLLQSASGGGLRLQRLESQDIEGGERVEVSALLLSTQRSDQLLERSVGRLSLEPSVSAARWRIAASD
ncbi:MgtC/SapB family protein [Pseudomonas sp.]|uniref:MgtC/SapB family protein n=1 Tax=Pseudomonas sp. TaxID=306 RepID=UPI003C76850E